MKALIVATRSPDLADAINAWAVTARVAARFHVPAGMLRDWEQARATAPDFVIAYVRVIGQYPEMVAQAVGKGSLFSGPTFANFFSNDEPSNSHNTGYAIRRWARKAIISAVRASERWTIQLSPFALLNAIIVVSCGDRENVETRRIARRLR